MISGIIAWGAVYLITLFFMYSKAVSTGMLQLYVSAYLDGQSIIEGFKEEMKYEDRG